METAFEEKIVWEVEEDLKMLVREYHSLLEQKKTVILLSLKEASEFPELDALTKHIPQNYINKLEKYFEIMIKKRKIKNVDTTTVAKKKKKSNINKYKKK